MADQSHGDGWWQASDGKWYPPESYPAAPVAPPPQTAMSPAAPANVASGAPALPANVTIASPWIRLGSYLVEGLLVVVTLGIGWLIWAAMIGGDGQTPAKKMLGLRVVRGDNMQPAGLGRMFWLRGILAGFVASLAITFTIGILLFMPFWDKRNQNIWDKVSNTYVVNDPNDAWNTRPDLR